MLANEPTQERPIMPITKINPDTLPDAGALGYTQTVTSPPASPQFSQGLSL